MIRRAIVAGVFGACLGGVLWRWAYVLDVDEVPLALLAGGFALIGAVLGAVTRLPLFPVRHEPVLGSPEAATDPSGVPRGGGRDCADTRDV